MKIYPQIAGFFPLNERTILTVVIYIYVAAYSRAPSTYKTLMASSALQPRVRGLQGVLRELNKDMLEWSVEKFKVETHIYFQH